MKKLLYACIGSCMLTMNTSCSHELAPQNHYQSETVSVDGNAGDWTLPLRYSNSEYTLSYNITNDDQNIYLCMLTKDDEMKRRILKAGMTLYFDPKAEKHKSISLAYPLPNNNRQQVNDEAALLLNADTYNTTGFLGIENGRYSSTSNKNGIKLALRIDNDSSLVYEASIPVNLLFKDGLNKKALKKNFSIGIITGVLADSRPPSGRYNDQRMTTNTPRMMPRMGIGGGMRGMGMGMGRMGGGGYSRRTTESSGPKQKEEALWNVFSFASGKS